jgi:hypothetical protein
MAGCGSGEEAAARVDARGTTSFAAAALASPLASVTKSLGTRASKHHAVLGGGLEKVSDRVRFVERCGVSAPDSAPTAPEFRRTHGKPRMTVAVNARLGARHLRSAASSTALPCSPRQPRATKSHVRIVPETRTHKLAFLAHPHGAADSLRALAATHASSLPWRHRFAPVVKPRTGARVRSDLERQSEHGVHDVPSAAFATGDGRICRSGRRYRPRPELRWARCFIPRNAPPLFNLAGLNQLSGTAASPSMPLEPSTAGERSGHAGDEQGSSSARRRRSVSFR